MGKGTIISHDGSGQYTVEIEYDRTGIDAQVSELESIVSRLQEIIDDEESTIIQKQYAKINQLAAQKRIDYLQSTNQVPANENVQAWCADLTTDLSGEVGIIEVARERQHGLNIQPGYDGNAAYNSTRDGQLIPGLGLDPVMHFLNLAFLPGAQKWKPMYRYGTITAIYRDTDTCTVSLDGQQSSQQGLSVNQETELSGVPISYMTCDSAAFSVGDKVVVKFADYDWINPTVIGFQQEPKPCGSGGLVVII